MSQEPFDLAWPEAASPARQGEGNRKTKEAVTKDVTWRKIDTVVRPKCDVCIGRMEHGAAWHAPDPVVWERTGHGTLAYLCYWHAAPLRANEGLQV